MAIKVYPPFGIDANHKITQTYHSTPVQYAVDVSGIAGRSVFGHEGKVVYVEKALGQRNYVALDIGEPELLFYVHVNPLVEVGQTIRMGQKIATVYKAVLFPSHLHFTFQRKDRKASSMKIMDYVDRRANWYATGTAIKALWCKADGTIDWRKFGNKYVGVDEVTELKLQIASLKVENAKLVEGNKLLEEAVKGLNNENKLLTERNTKLEEDMIICDRKLKAEKVAHEVTSTELQKCRDDITELEDQLEKKTQELKKYQKINGLLSALFKKLVDLFKRFIEWIKSMRNKL